MPIDLESLNPPQKEAVEYIDGPLLILAGAGSGKTRAITYRIVHMIKDLNIPPQNILAITFTNKAAAEMKSRAANLIGDSCAMPTMCTYHSLGARILRDHCKELGYDRRITVCDDEDQKKRLIKAAESFIEDKKLAKSAAMQSLPVISSFKDNLMMPKEAKTYVYSQGNADAYHKILKIYTIYQENLEADCAVDFDDLITKVVLLFKDHSDILDSYRELYRYLMIDEYQDTSHAQFELARLLSGKYHNICVVGDDYQSIYKFRGADITNILNFNKQYPDAKVITLGQNYRSTKTIVNAAAELISNNAGQMKKTLFTDNIAGQKIRVYHKNYSEDCGKEITNIIDDGVRHGASYEDYAILYRANFLSREAEDALLRKNIPYVIYGGISFYQRAEIKDIIAYLKLVTGYRDSIALERVINIPSRGIGKKALSNLFYTAVTSGVSVFDAMKESDNKKIAEFVDILNDLKEKAKNHGYIPSKMIREIIEEIKYEDYLEKKYSGDEEGKAQDKIENIRELVNKAVEYEIEYRDRIEDDRDLIDAFIEDISLLTDMDRQNDDNSVKLMTLHRSKGLEYDHVIITGMDEGLFPRYATIDELEEERRLMYVGMTRARKTLTLINCSNRLVYGDWKCFPPSQFIDEIPTEYLAYSA